MATIPIPTQGAETVAREFVQNIVLKYGIPEVILTDQVANIFSELFTNFAGANREGSKDCVPPRIERRS